MPISLIPALSINCATFSTAQFWCNFETIGTTEPTFEEGRTNFSLHRGATPTPHEGANTVRTSFADAPKLLTSSSQVSSVSEGCSTRRRRFGFHPASTVGACDQKTG